MSKKIVAKISLNFQVFWDFIPDLTNCWKTKQFFSKSFETKFPFSSLTVFLWRLLFLSSNSNNTPPPFSMLTPLRYSPHTSTLNWQQGYTPWLRQLGLSLPDWALFLRAWIGTWRHSPRLFKRVHSTVALQIWCRRMWQRFTKRRGWTWMVERKR